ncbi:mitochondrial 54S ribosomal protein uL10m KNAG_0A02450 [Huiozyma naganishii CBS 8797]|uniref:Ribosomal protein L10 n=1 Tax=Huiozyma naganishii (strain ATCC MYA-139 / BCRC 22969 / CBS 8797 / KCTC 17520 / NBRC 10181 / NCYC 3082 / Yp74L-3) TaxID=1071383 RepID=J7S218_HUIN7|nr:hypothetical protein KNAG_0A02450 [Kazachstania naganishii CBS 8797]CCK67934.1 hypothetical protein KNAG_0A02450 [Kazachstania naganishii CBS 8797]
MLRSVIALGGRPVPQFTAQRALQTAQGQYRAPPARRTAKGTPQQRLTVKPLDSRKTYLIDLYRSLLEGSPLVLFVHYNNLLKSEDHYFRDQIAQLGGQLTKVRNALLEVYLRNSRREDPCSPVVGSEARGELIARHPLLPLLFGPTAMITFDAAAAAPQSVAKLLRLFAASGHKLFVVGARLDGTSVLDSAGVAQFSTLPSREQLHAQLVQVLNQLSGVGLVQTLQQPSSALYMTLRAHETASKDKTTEP